MFHDLFDMIGCFKVQLVGRHLIFTDATGGTEEVPRGSAGVVGHTPVLEPGQSFEYYSGMYVVVVLTVAPALL